MKTFTATIFALFMTIGTFAACDSKKAVTPDTEPPAGLKTLAFKNFDAIENQSNLHLVFTLGNKYAVAVDEKGVNRSEISLKGKTICISVRDDTHHGNGNVQTYLYVTAPALNVIENRGNMSFKSNTIEAGDFKLNNSGNLNADIAKVAANNVEITNRGNAQVRISTESQAATLTNSGRMDIEGATFKSGNTDMKNTGGLSFRINSVEVTDIKLRNSGRLDIGTKIKANSCTKSNYGMLEGKIDVTANEVKLYNSGRDKLTIKSKTKTFNISNLGAGDISIDIDSEKINIDNNGACSIDISGTSDNVSITGKGSQKVNVSELNKY